MGVVNFEIKISSYFTIFCTASLYLCLTGGIFSIHSCLFIIARLVITIFLLIRVSINIYKKNVTLNTVIIDPIDEILCHKVYE